MTGHFARMCRKVKSGNSRRRGRNINGARLRRVNLIGRDGGQPETGSENGDNKMAKHAETATSDIESETTTTQSRQDKQSSSETTNQTELAEKQEQTTKKQTAALAELKQKMRKRQLAEYQKKTIKYKKSG